MAQQYWWYYVVGSTLGIVSFIILLYRFYSEKPILKFTVWRCYHYYEPLDNRSSLIINMIVDNVGERGTAIKGIELMNMIPNTHIDKAMPTYWEIKQLQPHTSLNIHQPWNFRSVILNEDEIKIEVVVLYTHGEKKLTHTSKKRELLSEREMEGRPKLV